MLPRFYPCPKCGKLDASWDGYSFCGPCETDYRREQRSDRRFEKLINSTLFGLALLLGSGCAGLAERDVTPATPAMQNALLEEYASDIAAVELPDDDPDWFVVSLADHGDHVCMDLAHVEPKSYGYPLYRFEIVFEGGEPVVEAIYVPDPTNACGQGYDCWTLLASDADFEGLGGY